MATFGERMVRAAMLHTATYEEVEADRGATLHALGVVVLASVAAGLGLGASASGIVVGILVSIFAWYVWALLTYWIGTRLLPEPQTSASQGEMLRVIGFAASPGLIRVLGLVAALRDLVFAVAAVWMLVAGIVAVRQALDYRATWRAVVVVLIGWVVQWVVLALLLALAGRGPA